MKPIVMTRDAKLAILKSFVEKFEKEFSNYEFNLNDTKISFSFEASEVAKDKITILYTQQAYLRMMALVDFYDTEVGWYGLVEKLDDRLYRVYDVKICKQYVTGSKVDTEDEDTLEFFDSLTDDEIEHMHFQAHSHVKMSTSASGTDLQNQADVIRNMGMSGFYIFQIWNKSNDINTYLYDLDNNIFYDKKDVIIEIEDDEDTISDFIASTIDLVQEKKFSGYNGYNSYKPSEKKQEKEPEKQTSYLPGYYPYDERWDY